MGTLRPFGTILVAAGVLFLLSTPVLADDSLYVDATGKVGVGTTTPARKLHVSNGSSGATFDSAADVVIEDDGAAVLQFATPSSENAKIVFGDPNGSQAGAIKYRHSTNDMTFRTAGTDRVLIDSAGRVGIGTLEPQQSLVVAKGSGTPVIETVKIDDDIGGGAYLGQLFFSGQEDPADPNSRYVTARIMARAVGAWDDNNKGSRLLFYATPKGTETLTEMMRIDESGSVGIGTTLFGGGKGVLALGDAAAVPHNAPANTAVLYCSAGKLWVFDANGNNTVLSSHPSEEIDALAEADDPYPLFHKSSNRVIGKELVIDMGKALRLLQTLFPEERFIWYRDIPKVDAVKQQRQAWKEQWIAEHTAEAEIDKREAFETVRVKVDDESKVVGEKVSYRLEGEEVKEVRRPVYAKKLVEQRRLREGVRFDTETGKFYLLKVPTEAEAEAAADKDFQFTVDRWVEKRM